MIGASSTAAEIIAHLETLRSQEAIAGMARAGIVTDGALGISNPDLQKIARRVKTDSRRAQTLWSSGIREARLLALYTIDPLAVDADQARRFAADFASWEIVDTAADLFVSARLEILIGEFAADRREYVRRAAFAMIAGAAVHLKAEPDAIFIGYLPLIEQHATDPRNYVRKAVNWALRNIGKRSLVCHGPALELATRLAQSDDKTACWIGRHAARQLSDPRRIARLRR